MARDFELVWKETECIYGAFEKEEAYRMYLSANSCGKGAVFVEIGSYCGRSSSVLGMVAKDNGCDLTCIDNFIESAPNIDSVQESFTTMMKRLGIKHELMAMSSEGASKKYDKKIDLLFIDANHHYEGVKLDAELWIPKVKPRGWILFHDYHSSWKGVKKAVDELKYLENLGETKSLAIRRKPENMI